MFVRLHFPRYVKQAGVKDLKPSLNAGDVIIL